MAPAAGTITIDVFDPAEATRRSGIGAVVMNRYPSVVVNGRTACACPRNCGTYCEGPSSGVRVTVGSRLNTTRGGVTILDGAAAGDTDGGRRAGTTLDGPELVGSAQGVSPDGVRRPNPARGDNRLGYANTWCPLAGPVERMAGAALARTPTPFSAIRITPHVGPGRSRLRTSTTYH